MTILYYQTSYRPTAYDSAAISRLEEEGHRVQARNAQFFDKPEKADCVVTSSRRVREAYEAAGVRVGFPETDEVEEPQVSHEKKGGGWFWIYVDGEKVDSVREHELEEALARHGRLV